MARVTLSGLPPDPYYAGPTPQPLDPVTKRPRDYWVLPATERISGLVRNTYRHDRCGILTRMRPEIAETFATRPTFYSHMYCAECLNLYPITEFVWRGTLERLGQDP